MLFMYLPLLATWMHNIEIHDLYLWSLEVTKVETTQYELVHKCYMHYTCWNRLGLIVVDAHTIALVIFCEICDLVMSYLS